MLDCLLKPFRKRFGENRHYYKIIYDIFGICPNNIELYKLALIHRSASVFLPDGTTINNERLEFLGDAVLESIISEYLFIEFPYKSEGFLTQLRAKIVSRQTLNKLCANIGLSKHIISNAAGSVIQKHINGDALEAMIGAIYLDKGYYTANRTIITKILYKHLDMENMTDTETDFKSRMIEWCQKSKQKIYFNTLHTENSTAQNPQFKSIIMIDDSEVGYGFGSSKKEAEQKASQIIWEIFANDSGDSYLELVDVDNDIIKKEGNGKKSKYKKP